MLRQLINHSPDLKKLRDEGFEIEERGGFLLVHHVPYINAVKKIQYGTLVSELTLRNSNAIGKPRTHVIHFIGEHPCNKDGTVIHQIQHSSQKQTLAEGIIMDHSFSNKPAGGYKDYYEKISRYAEIISAPAKSLDRSVTEKTFRLLSDDNDETNVFHYVDTNSTRSSVSHINEKFKGQKIAIIGLGGTGAYILDLIAKTPVQEVHLFDGDDFSQHNAFRAPGAASNDDLNRLPKKVDYFTEIYTKMRKNVIPHCMYVTEDNAHILKEMTYVFICIDSNSSRKLISEALIKFPVPFIDVGMGVFIVDDSLIGTLRMTIATKHHSDHFVLRAPLTDNDDNDYLTNIQIADLNAFNAAMAVIRWKKLVGFYQDLEKEHHCSYAINVAQLRNEDTATNVV